MWISPLQLFTGFQTPAAWSGEPFYNASKQNLMEGKKKPCRAPLATGSPSETAVAIQLDLSWADQHRNQSDAWALEFALVRRDMHLDGGLHRISYTKMKGCLDITIKPN
jgi:hypothetical protein